MLSLIWRKVTSIGDVKTNKVCERKGKQVSLENGKAVSSWMFLLREKGRHTI